MQQHLLYILIYGTAQFRAFGHQVLEAILLFQFLLLVLYDRVPLYLKEF